MGASIDYAAGRDITPLSNPPFGKYFEPPPLPSTEDGRASSTM